MWLKVKKRFIIIWSLSFTFLDDWRFLIFTHLRLGLTLWDVFNLWVFELHMLKKGALSSVWFLALFYWAYVFALDFTCTPPMALFFLIAWIFLVFLKSSNGIGKLIFLFNSSFELSIEHIVGKKQLIDLFEIKVDCRFEIPFEIADINGFVRSQLSRIPWGIPLKLVLQCSNDFIPVFMFRFVLHFKAISYKNYYKKFLIYNFFIQRLYFLILLFF